MTVTMSRRAALGCGLASIFALTKLQFAAAEEKSTMAKEKNTQLQDLANLNAVNEQGQYILPDLPYPYEALEPSYSSETLHFHHDKHHATYVKGLNKALDQLDQANKNGDYSHIQAISRDLAFNGSGHILHCLFWKSMTPEGSDIPSELEEQIKKDFGSTDAFKKHFVEATKTVEASGWGVLAYEPAAGKLLILQAEKHQNLTVWGVVPLLVCDVWEHAYYLQFQNERPKWINSFMEIANWPFALERLKYAQRIS